MRRYYIDYYRDFANTYTVFVIENRKHIESLLTEFPGAVPITRKRAIERGWVRPRAARRSSEQWFGGFAQPLYGYSAPRTLSEALDTAVIGTLDSIETARANRGADAQAYSI